MAYADGLPYELGLEILWDSDEEVALEYLENVEPVRRRERQDMDYFELYNPREYRQRYRLTKETVSDIITRLEHRLAYNHIGAMTCSEQIHATLRYYATGCFQSTIGDLSGYIHQVTAGRVIRRVSKAIALEFQEEYIKMPIDPVEMNEISTSFKRMAGMPFVLGCVDCSHQGTSGSISKQNCVD
jgi:hypothetical protein